ncbi:TlpA disulfide reductase family protein [Nocardiopsis sp. N85]|uniref:TlpA disulfide reductase family protein n=1 Tax=Nocardiopsis sp. N85 TaxID=3029400 RepID=UPI00237F5FB3|nr:TlpA disulfide reductase family protein [Nocardiopsis sp. N85]MDE3724925.1 TlpA disulfide reductase family protein [Nocardiopsis sp. N85]
MIVAALIAACLAVVLCLLDLLLTVGVIRRLKEHTELIGNLSTRGMPGTTVLPPGERIGAFSAVTEDGDTVGSGALADPVLIAVFSPGCGACAEQLPRFLERAGALPGGRGSVLAVLAGDRAQVAEEAARLSPVARVVVDGPQGTVTDALGVLAFPAFLRVDGTGRVLSSGRLATDLDAPVAA